MLLTSCHSTEAALSQLLDIGLEQRPGTYADGRVCIRVEEAAQEEGNVILPGNSPKGFEVYDGQDVSVAVLLVADLELLDVGLIVHVPAKDYRAEAKRELLVLDQGEEFLFGHELASQDTVDIAASDLDGVIMF